MTEKHVKRKNYHREKLQKYLLPLSRSKEPDDMMAEWEDICMHYAWSLPEDGVRDHHGRVLSGVHFVPSKRLYDGRNSGIDCPCSHVNIHHLCYIRNKLTLKTVIVGCDCVNKFMDVHLPRGFWPRVERMYLREPVILTEEMLNALPPFTLNDWQKDFMANMQKVGRKTGRLSDKQLNTIVRVNTHILRQINRWHLIHTDPTFTSLPWHLQHKKVAMLLDNIFNELTKMKEEKARKKQQRTPAIS